MHVRLAQFAQEHNIAEPTLSALESLIAELIDTSLQKGQSILIPSEESFSSYISSDTAHATTLSMKKLTPPPSSMLPVDLDATPETAPLETPPNAIVPHSQHPEELDASISWEAKDEVPLENAGERPEQKQEKKETPAQEELRPSQTMPPLTAEERYELHGVLGAGGMGRVHRVKDWRLNRTVAMKILHPNWLTRTTWVKRFIEEAQTTAKLQHPGIVPVHDLGQFSDGRFYFTMKEIVGRTMSEVIKELHAAVRDGRWQTTPSGWSFRRLLDAYHRVCETVAYAHSCGVLHRDLKPENIMIGEHGEVKVVDWGLVKHTPKDSPSRDSLDSYSEGVELDETKPPFQPPPPLKLSDSQLHQTQFGEIKGTPAYMAPEQATGDIDQIGPATDVYGLGGILYEILSGEPPYTGTDVRTLIFRLLSEPPPLPGRLELGRSFRGTLWEEEATGESVSMVPDRPELPWSLVRICGKAMARLPQERYENAGVLAHEIEQWLEGAQKRARALELVESAKMRLPAATALRMEAYKRRHQSRVLLSQVKAWEPEEKKRKGWEQQDQAKQFEWEAWLQELEAEQELQAALSHVRDLEEAHVELVKRYEQLHREAEAEHRSYSKMRAERYLQNHAESLPPNNSSRKRAIAYLNGEGALSLETDPPGASVLLYRYVKENRRLKPVFVRFLGETPLREVRLGMGSYLLVLRKEGYEEVRYPVCLERMERWDGRPPDQDDPVPISLLPHGSVASNECYIPSGWYWAGGDPDALNALSRKRLWVDGFIMQKYAITNTQYIAFLDDLVAHGKEREALRYAPQERSGSTEEQGALIYGRTPEGGFVLRPDTEGDIWYPNYPVLMVDWFGAMAYARWFSSRTKQPWRLPSELEWEKAARGTDGRYFPWGDFLDPSWCCMRDSRPGRPLPSVTGSHEEDQSPYGVRELAGNVLDWCLDIFQPHGPPTPNHRVEIPMASLSPEDTVEDAAPRVLRVRRGGGWDLSEKLCRSATRIGENPQFRDYMSGFRLVRSLWPY